MPIPSGQSPVASAPEAESSSAAVEPGVASGVGCCSKGTVMRSLGLVFAWYFFSMSLSLYNKFLIGQKHGHFPAPLLMTTFHFLLQWALSSFLINCCCTSWAPTTRMACRDYNLRIVPTAMATALDIGLSNLSLALITLTFYTMCKSSAPVFLLLFAFVFRVEAFSLRLLGIMVVISVGVLFTVAGETNFQVLGFFLVMGSSIISGLRWVLIQVLLQKEKLGLTNPLVTMAYLTPIMALICAVFSVLYEPWHLLHQSSFFDTWPHAMHSLVIMVLGGLLAFFMILAEFLLVLETSAVTFSVAGTVKEGATILVSHVVFGDRFTRTNLIGIFVILIGVSLFNLYRSSRGGHGQKEARPLLPSLSSEAEGAEDCQRLLAAQHANGMSDGVSLGPSPSASLRSPKMSPHDDAQVIVATGMLTEQQQLRIASLNVVSPRSPCIHSIEMQQRTCAAADNGHERHDSLHDE